MTNTEPVGAGTRRPRRVRPIESEIALAAAVAAEVSGNIEQAERLLKLAMIEEN